MKAVLDFESFSAINIGACGAHVYAAHPSTGVLCLAVKVDEEPGETWVPGHFESIARQAGLPVMAAEAVAEVVAEADELEAHNVFYERCMWRYHMLGAGFPELPEDKLRCSMAKAAMHALPRALGNLCVALDLPQEFHKDERGKDLIKKLSIPRSIKPKEWLELEEKFGDDPVWCVAREAYKRAEKDKLWAYLGVLTNNWREEYREAYFYNRDPKDLQDMFAYCLQDVEAEHAASKMMHDLTPGELEVWRLDQKINARGIRVDRAGAQCAIDMVAAHSVNLTEELVALTNGMARTAKQNAVLTQWAKTRGVELPDMKAATVEVFLKKQDLPDDVRRMLQIRASLNKASTAKYKAALNASQIDGKMRGCLIYNAAGPGRWAGALVQPHNLPRGTVKLTDDAMIDIAYWSMEQGGEITDMLYGDPMDLASSAIRGMFIADPGHVFYASDFSSVEARKLPWLAGDTAALDVFWAKKDPYKVAAGSIFNVAYEAVQKPQRQVGKVSELALGYGGGIGAYASMARVYRIDLETLPPFILPIASDREKIQAESTAQSYLKELDRKIKYGIGNVTELDRMSLEAAMACDIIKQKWRKGRPKTVQFWKDLEDTAMLAVMNPGQAYHVGRISYCVKGKFLLCRLPSGRVIFYYKPFIKLVQKFGKKSPALHYWGMKALDGGGQKYQEIQTYGGKLAENVTQGSCACLLRAAMLRAEAAGYPVVLHVHDEVVAQRREGEGDLEEFNRIVAEVPGWADGLPMGASGWVGTRYRKD